LHCTAAPLSHFIRNTRGSRHYLFALFRRCGTPLFEYTVAVAKVPKDLAGRVDCVSLCL
jgi:hypothetical protein